MKITLKMLKRLIDEFNAKGWNYKAVIIARDGEISDRLILSDALLPQYSITKAFTATAIGVLIDRALINADDEISIYIDEILKSDNDRLKRVKIRHLLSNSSGTDKGYLFEADRFTHGTDDYLNLIISKELIYEPGEKYAYSNSNFYLLSLIIQRVTNKASDDFIRDNIFKPLNITEYKATRCPKGHFLGGSGLYLKTEDMIKLAIMYGNDGLYMNNGILSESFIRQALSRQIAINSKEHYGFSFMMKDTNNVFVPGNYNQMLFINKTGRIFVAVNSDVRPSDTGTLMKIIRRVINSQ